MRFNVTSVFKAFEMLVLSWTSYAPLAKASDPEEFDFVLRKTIRDIKFHCETLLSMLFFMGTTMDTDSPLISWTLASLLYSLISYTALEAMSGESLHLHLDGIPAGRPILACLAKFPALTVLVTLCALAMTSWTSVFTLSVLFACVGVLGLALALRLSVFECLLAMVRAGAAFASQFFLECLLRCRRAVSVGAAAKRDPEDARRGASDASELSEIPRVPGPICAHGTVSSASLGKSSSSEWV